MLTHPIYLENRKSTSLKGLVRMSSVSAAHPGPVLPWPHQHRARWSQHTCQQHTALAHEIKLTEHAAQDRHGAVCFYDSALCHPLDGSVTFLNQRGHLWISSCPENIWKELFTFLPCAPQQQQQRMIKQPGAAADITVSRAEEVADLSSSQPIKCWKLASSRYSHNNGAPGRKSWERAH